MRIEKLQKLKEAGIDPYPAKIKRSKNLGEVAALDSQTELAFVSGRVESLEDTVEKDVNLQVIWLRDEYGSLALTAISTNLDSTSQLVLENLDVGDYIEVAIVIDESTVFAKQIKMICKAMLSVPEQPQTNWEAILARAKDPSIFYFRSKFIHTVRNYFHEHGFLEVDTPIMSPATDFDYMLHPFRSEMEYKDGTTRPVFLHISPEYFMKRALVAGFEKIFQITKFFRNGDISYKHNPEFLAIEWYEAYVGYQETMARLEQMCTQVISNLKGQLQIEYQGHQVDLTPPWPKISVTEAIRKFVGVELEDIVADSERITKLLTEAGVTQIPQNCPWEKLFTILLEYLVEPNLGLDKPIFVIDYPRMFEFGQMAKVGAGGEVVERFELYIAGLELCNGFTELNDPGEQAARFKQCASIMNEQGQESDTQYADQGFIRALEFGLPPTGGVALGLDRLLMIVSDASSIDEVILFPFNQLI